VADYAITVAAGGTYRAHIADFGGKLSRTELHIALDGEGTETHLSGVSVLNGHHADVTTHVTHAVGKTRSTQLFKYVAGGHSRGIYQGKVSVAPGANGSDSRQSAKGLLLGNRAEIDLKPELEILADDVKCAHGAAVGDLDAESLFYLNARGIPEGEARALLMRAFIGDAVDQIEDETIRATVWQTVDAALETLS
jgi:Fe-S cluster assembly protein SufD